MQERFGSQIDDPRPVGKDCRFDALPELPCRQMKIDCPLPSSARRASILSQFVTTVAALMFANGGVNVAYACGGLWDVGCNIGKTLERAVQDTGKTIEKGAHDVGHTL